MKKSTKVDLEALLNWILETELDDFLENHNSIKEWKTSNHIYALAFRISKDVFEGGS